ncbi:MAG: DNA ligase [Candidatus Accumulibacter sp. UW26]|jgi:DNA ligase-1
MRSNQQTARMAMKTMKAIVQALVWGVVASPLLPLQAVERLPLLLAESEQGEADVALYLVSEKLDGVRAFWDGQVLRTRNGHPVLAPAWFVAGFPAQPLDGELWIGRGQFERVAGVVRRQTPDDAQWRQVRYLVFELPQAPGTFRQRAEALRELTAERGLPWLQAVEQWEFGSRRALDEKLEKLLRAGGEGLMLHRADAPYVTGRSAALLKLKPWQDAEATVIGHQPGRGKYAGMLGALRLRTADGVEFMLGTGFSAADRLQPPAIGSQITFRYRALTARGLPRFASYQRPRDL